MLSSLSLDRVMASFGQISRGPRRAPGGRVGMSSATTVGPDAEARRSMRVSRSCSPAGLPGSCPGAHGMRSAAALPADHRLDFDPGPAAVRLRPSAPLSGIFARPGAAPHGY